MAEEPDALKNSIAGTFAGWVQVLVGQPFDIIKVRLQSQGQGAEQLYKGALDCGRKILQQEGPWAFYKGTLSPLLGVGLCVSIQFAAVEQAKGYFNRANHGGQLTLGQYYLAGAFAGVTNSIVSGPVEHIRTRLQVQVTSGGKQAEYSGMMDCVKKIYKTAGVPGIYKGQVITIIREFQGYGGYFLAYEWTMNKMAEMTKTKRTELNSGLVMLAGACGGFTMWIPIFPVDAVKSKMQTDGFGSKAKFTSTWDCVRKTYAAEGIAGFYRGFWPCMFRAAPVR